MTSQDQRGKARAAFATYAHNFSQRNPDWARPFLRRNLHTALEQPSRSSSRRDQSSSKCYNSGTDTELSDNSIKQATSCETARTNLNVGEIFIWPVEDHILNRGQRRKMLPPSPICLRQLSVMNHQDIILFYTYTTINDKGLVEAVQDEIKGRGFICALCKQKNPSWNILRHHLKVEHEEFGFTCTVSTVDPNVFFVRFEESEATMQRNFLLDQTDVIQLGPPRRKFDFKQFLDGEDELWVSSRRGPDDETAGSRGRRNNTLRHAPVESETPTVESLEPSPMTIFEFDVPAPSPQPRKLLIVPETKGRLFHSKSKRILIPGEMVPEDEDDIDIEWRIARHTDVLRDFTDLSDEDKEYAIHFDAFLMRKSRVERGGIRPTFVQFVRENEAWIVERRSRSFQLGLHMATLKQRGGKGGMDMDTIEYVARLIRDFRKKRGLEEARDVINVRKEIENPKEVWPPPQVRRRGFCSCLTFVYPGPDQLICSNIYCMHRKYHRGCLGIPETVVYQNFGPDQFKCEFCSKKALSPEIGSTPIATTSVVSPRLIEHIDRTLDQHPSSPSTMRPFVIPKACSTKLNGFKSSVEIVPASSVNWCPPSILDERPVKTRILAPVGVNPPKATLETALPLSDFERHPASPRTLHLDVAQKPSLTRANLATPTIEISSPSTSWARPSIWSPSGRQKEAPKASPVRLMPPKPTLETTLISYAPSQKPYRSPYLPPARIQSPPPLINVEPDPTVVPSQLEIPNPVVASAQFTARTRNITSAEGEITGPLLARPTPSNQGPAESPCQVMAAPLDGSLATSSEPSLAKFSDQSPTTLRIPTQASSVPTVASSPISTKPPAHYGSQNNPVELESSPEPEGSSRTQITPRRQSEKIIIDLLGKKPKQLSGRKSPYPLVRANPYRRKPPRSPKYA